MHPQGCYNALWEYIETINPRDFDQDVEHFGIEEVFHRLRTYVVEHQISFEPSIDTYEESSFGTNEENDHDVPKLVIINDSEPEEESVAKNNLVITSPKIIEVSSESYTPTTQPLEVFIIPNDTEEMEVE